MDDAVVLVEQRGAIQLITLNRPKAKNAINGEVSRAVEAALDELDERDDLSVGIVTGAGGTFCAGMDLKAFATGGDVSVPRRGFGGICGIPSKKPLIAAVEGWALAGGTEIALSCDLIVAAEDANFGIPEVKRGLMAAAGGLIRLPRLLPLTLAMELALTGDPLSAADAHRYGMVNRLTPTGGALDAALELAGKITANGPLALRVTKETMLDSLDLPFAEALQLTEKRMGEVIFTSEDAIEGATAFAEKRAPAWKGR